MPAFDFPTSPTDGQVYENYIYDATRGVWNLRTVEVNTRFFVSDTPPSNPVEGDAWFDTSEGVTYIYYTDSDSAQWVESGNPVLSYLGVSDLEDIDLTSLSNGDILQFDGTNWVNINAIAQSQVTGLDAGTAGYTALSNGTAGLSYQPASHNYVINGAFDIWQRGDGPFTFSNRYTADRFNANNLFGSVTKQTFAPADIEAIGFGDAKYFARLDQTTAASFGRLEHRIEDVRTLAGQTATFSFWAKADTERTFQSIYRQNFGSGGSSTAVGVFGDVTIGTTWQRYTLTTTIGSVLGKTIGDGSYLQVELREPDSATYTLDTWGWQLEAGSIATPFKRNANSIAGELAACQRYYYKIYDSDVAGQGVFASGFYANATDFRAPVFFPVEMLKSPDLKVTSLSAAYTVVYASATAVDDFTQINDSKFSAILRNTSVSGTAGQAGYIRGNSPASRCIVAFEAEL